jgi:hypothetical protein
VDPEKDYPFRKFSAKEGDFEDDIGYGKASMVFHLLRRMAVDSLELWRKDRPLGGFSAAF